ncbi:MAG: hypothetical protein WDZ47_01200 [Bacteroidales bacterium]
MYYDRTLSNSFSKLIEQGGNLRWLFDFVKKQENLDFLIGKSKGKEWISIYMGLTRILSIHPTKDSSIIKVEASKTYKTFPVKLYDIKPSVANFEKDIDKVIDIISKDKKFDRYYNNMKEGYFQNILSRRFGINGKSTDDFVIIDKEAVIGYTNKAEKNLSFGKIHQKYKKMQKEISTLNSKRYGKNLQKKAIGNELDFLALDKEGNILLIEYKHGTNTSGIYLSPLQIGLYYDIFTNFPKIDLEKSIFSMFSQKQRIGLVNSSWKQPEKIKDIIPVLIVSEYNYRGSAKEKFDEILNFSRKTMGSCFLENLRTHNFTEKSGLSHL